MWPGGRRPVVSDMPRPSKYTRETLAPVVARNTSMGAVLDDLGLRRAGGNYRHIGQRIEAYSIDTSHFLGQAHLRGATKETNPTVAALRIKNRTPDADVFEEGSTYPPSKLAKRLLELGWPYACAVCGLGEWRGEAITLHVDHTNGRTSDNRLETLRFLCPDCHPQTRTWGAKKRT